MIADYLFAPSKIWIHSVLTSSGFENAGIFSEKSKHYVFGRLWAFVHVSAELSKLNCCSIFAFRITATSIRLIFFFLIHEKTSFPFWITAVKFLENCLSCWITSCKCRNSLLKCYNDCSILLFGIFSMNHIKKKEPYQETTNKHFQFVMACQFNRTPILVPKWAGEQIKELDVFYS